MDGRDNINNKKDDIKNTAETNFGFEVILLHKLGYNLWQQSKLTRIQKRFLINAYNHFKEVISETSENSNPEEDKKQSQKEKLLEELKRRHDTDG